MFEALIARAGRAAEMRARTRSAALAARIAAELPGGLTAGADESGVRLSGRGLRRRFALEPGLRWLMAGLGRW